MLGAVFCVLQAAPLPVSLPCPGSGCRLFQDFTVMGISLWWAGAAYFALVLLLCLRKATAACLFLATTALLLDAVLLVIMLLSASCIACLGAALLMGLLFLVIRAHAFSKTPQGPGISLVFTVWAGLFLAAGAMAGTELMGPWQLYGPENAERRVYFSPSCPACRDAVAVFASGTAFIPVAERDSDYAAIHHMQNAVKAGKNINEALAGANGKIEDAPWSLQALAMRFNLLRNKAEVLRLGFDTLPVIMVSGMPRALRPGYAAGLPGPARPGASDLPPELSPVDSCGNEVTPCDPPASSTPALPAGR